MQGSADFHVKGGAPETDFLQLWDEQMPHGAILHVRGEIDLWTAPRLGDRLDHFLKHGSDLILDFSDVAYFDLSGLEVLEDAVGAFRARRRLLLLASPSSIVRRIMGILNIQEIETFPTISEAQKFLQDKRTS